MNTRYWIPSTFEHHMVPKHHVYLSTKFCFSTKYVQDQIVFVPNMSENQGFFNWPNPSSCTMSLMSNQPLTVKGGWHIKMTTSPPSVSWYSRKCVSHDVPEPNGPPQPISKDSFTFFYPSRDSSVGVATCYGLDNQGGGSSSPSMVKNFYFSISSRPAMGSTQPPVKWVPEGSLPGVKRQGREADNSPPTSADVKKMWI
jgi:hypothetical protein